MRLVVSGGRTFFNYRSVQNSFKQFIQLHGQITLLIHGDSEGLDRTAAYVARQWGIPIQEFPADWNNVTCPGAVIRYRRGQAYNALAGHWRNGNMITIGKPDWGMVFPGKRGTADMTERLELAGIPIWRVEE